MLTHMTEKRTPDERLTALRADVAYQIADLLFRADQGHMGADLRSQPGTVRDIYTNQASALVEKSRSPEDAELETYYAASDVLAYFGDDLARIPLRRRAKLILDVRTIATAMRRARSEGVPEPMRSELLALAAADRAEVAAGQKARKFRIVGGQ